MRVALRIASLFVPMVASASPAAEVLCKNYNLTGIWSIRQDNGPVVEMTVVQVGDKLTGSAKSGGVLGGFSGELQKREISFRIDWTNNTAGVYLGQADDFDVFSGVSYQADNKANNTGWKMTAPATCNDV